MKKLLRKFRRIFFDSDPSFCDMHDDAHARQAAAEPLAHICRLLAESFGSRPLSILDAGCQAGRFLIPLAADGHQLTGIDASSFALRRAQRHAKQRSLSVRLHAGRIAKLRHWVSPESLDAVVCTEVLYLCEDYQQLLRLLADSVKPGGLLFISHRPAVYYVAAALRRGDPERALAMLDQREGASPEGAYHNWQTEEQLRALYRGLGLSVRHCYPVDRLSWHCDLSGAPDRVRQLLQPFQANGARLEIPAYLLVVSQKRR